VAGALVPATFVQAAPAIVATTDEKLLSANKMASGPSQSSLKQNKMMMGRVTMQAAAGLSSVA
jgi:hypothetical protein